MRKVAQSSTGEYQQIAIDGKSLRRSHDRKSAKKMLHSVSAWSTENHFVLAQQAVDQKSVGVKRFAEITRNHWGIEKSLHWVLDMSFNEDQSRIRKGHKAENFGMLRRFAIGVIKQDSSKGSIRRKRKRAAWNDDFLISLLKTIV